MTEYRIPIKPATAHHLRALQFAVEMAQQRVLDAAKVVCLEHDIENGQVTEITGHAPFELVLSLPVE